MFPLIQAAAAPAAAPILPAAPAAALLLNSAPTLPAPQTALAPAAPQTVIPPAAPAAPPAAPRTALAPPTALAPSLHPPSTAPAPPAPAPPRLGILPALALHPHHKVNMGTTTSFANLLSEEGDEYEPTRIHTRRNQAPVHEDVRRVRRMIMESNGFVTLNPGEVRALKRLIGEGRRDSNLFVQGSFTTDDLEKLGLQVEDGFEGKGGWRPPTDDGSDNVGDDGEVSQLFTPADAVIAPNVTPGHDQPIPPEVVRALEVLQQGVQAPQAPQAPQAGGRPQAPQRRSQAAPAPADFEEMAMRIANGDHLQEDVQTLPQAEVSSVNIVRKLRHGKQKDQVRASPTISESSPLHRKALDKVNQL